MPGCCDTWLRFPDLSGEPRTVTCAGWGNADIRAHHVWWMRHLPHVEGASDGISWNRWEYVIVPNRVHRRSLPGDTQFLLNTEACD